MPEVLSTDLSSLVLSVLAWGAQPGEVAFPTPLPAPALKQAVQCLENLGAVTSKNGRLALTRHGRELLRYPLHPRIAHMTALAGEHIHLAAAVAALTETHPGKTRIDIRELLQTFSKNHTALKAARQIFRLSSGRGEFSEEKAKADESFAGVLLSLAWPERIAHRRTPEKYHTALGRMALLPAEAGALAKEEWLAIASMDGGSGETDKIRLAAPLSLQAIKKWHAADITEKNMLAWDSREQAVLARRRNLLGSLVLEDAPLRSTHLPENGLARAVIEGILECGLSSLPWTQELRQWQARVMLLRSVEGEAWPDASDRALADGLAAALADESCTCWLSPWIAGISRRSQFARIDLRSALSAMLPGSLARRLEKEAPERIAVPSGNTARIDYTCQGGPALTVKLQEMFGQTATPSVCGGKIPLTVHLLSPAGRPLQVTRDLAHFWTEGYAAVRAEMRGRYPRHPWPEDPLEAMPTGRTNRALKNAAERRKP